MKRRDFITLLATRSAKSVIGHREIIMKALLMLTGGALALMTTTIGVGNAETLNIVDSSNLCKTFTPTDDEHEHLEPFMNWLAGYRDAVAALTGLDERFKQVPRDISVLGAWVLSGCHANPDRSIGEVASGVFQMFINREPGPRLKLTLPRR